MPSHTVDQYSTAYCIYSRAYFIWDSTKLPEHLSNIWKRLCSRNVDGKRQSDTHIEIFKVHWYIRAFFECKWEQSIVFCHITNGRLHFPQIKQMDHLYYYQETQVFISAPSSRPCSALLVRKGETNPAKFPVTCVCDLRRLPMISKCMAYAANEFTDCLKWVYCQRCERHPRLFKIVLWEGNFLLIADLILYWSK